MKNIVSTFINSAKVDSKLSLKRIFSLDNGTLTNNHYEAEIELLVRIIKNRVKGNRFGTSPVISFIGEFGMVGNNSKPTAPKNKRRMVLSNGQNADDIKECLNGIPSENMTQELVELKEIIKLWNEWHSGINSSKPIPNEVVEKLNTLFGGNGIYIIWEGGLK